MKDWREEHREFSKYELSEQIHIICDAFDVAWRDGQRPRIEDYVCESDASNRVPILQELFLIELEYRRKIGETLNSSEYVKRFPDDANSIEQAFVSAAEIDTANISMDPIADTQL